MVTTCLTLYPRPNVGEISNVRTRSLEIVKDDASINDRLNAAAIPVASNDAFLNYFMFYS